MKIKPFSQWKLTSMYRYRMGMIAVLGSLFLLNLWFFVQRGFYWLNLFSGLMALMSLICSDWLLRRTVQSIMQRREATQRDTEHL